MGGLLIWGGRHSSSSFRGQMYAFILIWPYDFSLFCLNFIALSLSVFGRNVRFVPMSLDITGHGTTEQDMCGRVALPLPKRDILQVPGFDVCVGQ